MHVCRMCNIELVPSFDRWPMYCPNCGVEVFNYSKDIDKYIYTKNVHKGPARYVDRWWIIRLFKSAFTHPRVQTRQNLVDEILTREALNKAKPEDV